MKFPPHVLGLLSLAIAILPTVTFARVDFDASTTVVDAAPCRDVVPYGGADTLDSLARRSPIQLYILSWLWVAACFMLWPWRGESRLPTQTRRRARHTLAFCLALALVGPVGLFLSQPWNLCHMNPATNPQVGPGPSTETFQAQSLGSLEHPPGYLTFNVIAYAVFGLAALALLFVKIAVRALSSAEPQTASSFTPRVRRSLTMVGVISAFTFLVQTAALVLNHILYTHS